MMGNSKMKIVGVMAMVMMILALGDKSVWSMEGGSSITPMKFSCQAQCGIKCVLANIAYPICFAVCVSKCPKQVNSVCITRCDRNKSITINIDDRGVVTKVVDSCLQQCEGK